MKAIINVQDGSIYGTCNGKTFEVFKLWSHSVDLIGANPEFPNNGVNFTFNEIIIVDIQDELRSAKLNAQRLGGVHIDIYDYLKKYCKVKKIKAD